MFEVKEPYYITDFNLSKLNSKDWVNIDRYKNTYITYGESDIKNLIYPGYCFSNSDVAGFYHRYILDFIVNKLNSFTPPRGNLHKNNNFIFIGQRPGHFGAHLSKAESAWLLGPSSKMLMRFLKEVNIYPYLTNFYHSHFVMENKDWSNIYKELVGIFRMYKIFYNKEDFNIVFMGSYEEYDVLAEKLFDFDDVNINIIKMWHPSYLLRSYSDEKFNIWVNNFKNIIGD